MTSSPKGGYVAFSFKMDSGMREGEREGPLLSRIEEVWSDTS